MTRDSLFSLLEAKKRALLEVYISQASRGESGKRQEEGDTWEWQHGD